MNNFLIISSVITSSFGIALFLFGWLVTIATALGHKHIPSGIGIAVIFPLALLYCLFHWSATTYPRKLLFSGLALGLIGYLPFQFLVLDEFM